MTGTIGFDAAIRDRHGLEVLSASECARRLGRGGVGRVAVSLGALPAIFPVNYAVVGDDIVFKSGPGTKLTAALQGAVVAFEIDDSDRISHGGWSVMVVGPARRITDEQEIRQAEALPLASWAPNGDDVFIRVEARIVSGRAINHDEVI